MKSRRLAVVLIAAIALVVVSITGATARTHARHRLGVSAATHGACLLKGTANFTPGLTTTAKAESYTFSGTFSSCKGVTGITSGTVSASGAGNLSCGSGSSTGSATVSWNNGTSSTISFSTTSAAAGTVVQGTFTSG